MAASSEEVVPGGADELVDRAVAEPARRSRPRTIATGMRGGLAHDELGRARDLVGDRDLGDVQLPAPGVGLPRRSTTAASPETPIATSVSPWRQARPNVSETTTATSTPAATRIALRIRCAERSPSTGSSAA